MNDPIQKTKDWIDNIVNHYNLCPFAQKSFTNNQIDYQIINRNLFDNFISYIEEFKNLTNYSNSFLIHPEKISFEIFLEEFYSCEEYLESVGLNETYQIVCFHPQFQFENTPKDDRSNFVNRSPLPMIHILKVEEVSKAIDTYKGDSSKINEINTDLLNSLSEKEFLKNFINNKNE